MKKRAKKRPRPSTGETLVADFTRGFVATGLLAAFQDRTQCHPGAADQTFDDRRILRHALQGGVALASGSAAAQAWNQRSALRALVAIAAGATAVLTIEQTLRPNAQKTPQKNTPGNMT